MVVDACFLEASGQELSSYLRCCVSECVFIDVKKCAKRADFRRVSRDNFNVNVLFKIQLNEMIIEKTVE